MGVTLVAPEYSNNIIRFPKENIRNVLPVEHLNKEQLDDHLDLLKNYIIDEVIDIIIPAMYNQLAVIGYPIDDDTAKDGALIIESLRSLLLKKYDISHPLQDVANGMFSIDENDDLTLTGKLSIITNTSVLAVGNN